MSFKTRINALRRSLMRGLTKNVGSSRIAKDPGLSASSIKRILISRPNHRLGNLLLITPLLQEIGQTFPDCKVDLFVRGNLAPIIFQNYPNIDRIISLPKKPFRELIKYAGVWLSLRKRHYDIVINVDKNSSSGRLSVQFSNGRYKFFGDDFDWIANPDQSQYIHLAQYPVSNFRRYIEQIGLTKLPGAILALNLRLTTTERDHAKAELSKIADPEKRTIALFTFATGNKRYPESWWMPFYEALKKEFHDYNIIEVLPVENLSQLAFSAPSFYSKDIREIGALISHTDIFIGADSGIMHLASASRTPTLGLFSVTNRKMYEPYGNHSRGIDTAGKDPDALVKIVKEMLRDELQQSKAS